MAGVATGSSARAIVCAKTELHRANATPGGVEITDSDTPTVADGIERFEANRASTRLLVSSLLEPSDMLASENAMRSADPSEARERPVRSRRRSRLVPLLIQWGVVALAVGAWAVVTSTGIVKPYLLPSVGSTAAAFGRILTTATDLHNVGVTGLEVLGAFVFSTPVALALGFALGEIRQRHKKLGGSVSTLLSTFLATPKFVFLPLLIFLVGAGYWEKIIYAPADGMIIVIVGTATASYAVEGHIRAACRSIGMNKWQFFWKVYFPGSLPTLVESLRLSVILIFGGVMLCEMFISNAGIGFLLFQWGGTNDLPDLFAGVILVGVVATLINFGLQALENRLSLWRTDEAV